MVNIFGGKPEEPESTWAFILNDFRIIKDLS